MANILTAPLSGNIYFDDGSQDTTIPDLTGSAVALGFDGCAGLTVTSYNTASGDRFTVAGESGSLFSVNDSLTGTVFSVNDASGLPIIEVNSDEVTDTVAIGEYGTNALFVSAGNVGVGTATPTSPLHVCGNIAVTGTVDGRDIASDGTKLDGVATGATSCTGTVTSVTAGTGMTQSGSSTVNPTLNVIGGTGITANANDIALSTAGAGAGTYGNTGNGCKIDTITLDAYGRVTAVACGPTGSTSCTGTVTSVGITPGTGLDVSGSPITSSGNITVNLDLTEVTMGAGLDSTATGITLDLSELTDGTAAIVPTTDEVIYLDAGTQKRKRFSEIFGSNAYNSTAFTTCSGTVTSVATGNGISGGTITTSGTLTVGAGTGLTQTSTGLCINSTCNSTWNAKTTCLGTVTSVAAGNAGIDIGGTATDPTVCLDLTEITLGAGLDSTTTGLSLDLSEFTDMTGAIDPAVDEIILLDNGAERRKRFSEIFGSNAYNSTTIPTNNNQLTNGCSYGKITCVCGGTNLTGSGSSGTVTINMATGGAGAATYGSTSNGTKIDTITLDAYGRVTAVATGATGDINGVTAGTGMTGGGTSGTPTLNVIGGDGITANADNITVDSTVARTNVNETFSCDLTINGDLTVNGDIVCLETIVSTTSALSVVNHGSGPAITVNQAGSNDIVDFRDDNSSVFYIENGGFVGINDTNPGHRLDVNGNINATGSYKLDDNDVINSGKCFVGAQVRPTTDIADAYIASAATWNAKTTCTGTVTSIATTGGITGGTITGSGTLSIASACNTKWDQSGCPGICCTGTTTASNTQTFTNKTWNGVAIADAYISSASSWNACATSTQGTKADNALPKAGGTMSGAIAMGNSNITGVGALSFNDPGPNEGISWSSGNIKIYESPDNLTTNSAGNLQMVYGSTRRLTVNNTGIDVNGNIVVSGTVDGVDVAALATCSGLTKTGTVTSVATGNGISGGTITGSGTLTVGAGTGLTQTSTGLCINSTCNSTWNAKTTCTGTVTSIATSGGITGGTITSSGTLSIDTACNTKWDQSGCAGINCTGDITNVSVGTGLDGGGASGSVTITLDLSELTDMTGAIDPAVDEVILLDNGAERKKRFAEIFGSNAYNSTTIPTNNNQLTNGAGYTTCTGDITAVTAGTNLTGGGTSGSVTINMATGGVGAGTYGSTANGTKIDTITVDAYGRVTAVACGATGSTSCTGTVTSVATGNGISGGTITGSGTLTVGAGTGLTQTSTGLCVNSTCNTTWNSAYTTTKALSGCSGLACTGDITAVVAGTDLTGGANSGSATLNVTSATASTANRIVKRDGSGDINVRLLRSEYDTTNSSIGYIMTQVDTATNNYVRPSTMAQVRACLNVANGATSCTGTVTSVATGNGISGGTITGSGTLTVGAGTGLTQTSTGLCINSTCNSTWNAKTTCTGTVTSVATGNGISGGTITGSGTLTVGAGTGLTQTSTGLCVNSTCNTTWNSAYTTTKALSGCAGLTCVGDITAVTAGTNLTGGGTSGSVTINMATGGVGSGTYGSTANGTKIDTITVDAYGRVTAVATGATGSTSCTGNLCGCLAQCIYDSNNNFCIGANAGEDLTTGLANTSIGRCAGRCITTGGYNVNIGCRAGERNTTKNFNTFIGFMAGYCGGGCGNTAIGERAMCVSTGSNAVAIGKCTLRGATGSSNVAIGAQTGQSITSGSSNMLFGAIAGFALTTGSSNVFIGDQAARYITSGTNNVAIGKYAGRCHSSGTKTSGNNSIYIGADARAGAANSANEIVIGCGAQGCGTNTIRMGNTSITAAYIQTSWNTCSDARDKTCIADLDKGLCFIGDLQPKSYMWRCSRDSEETKGKCAYGFLAQDILALEDEGIIIDDNNPEHLSMKNDYLIPILVKGMQDQQKIIDKLEKRIAALEA